MSIEVEIDELLQVTNIKKNVEAHFNLKGKKKWEGLNSLAAMANITKRKDIECVLLGIAYIELDELDKIEAFLDAVDACRSFHLAKLLLERTTKYKDAHRKRLFMKELKRYVRSALFQQGNEKTEEIIHLINNSKWGKKQKENFLTEIEKENRENI